MITTLCWPKVLSSVAGLAKQPGPAGIGCGVADGLVRYEQLKLNGIEAPT